MYKLINSAFCFLSAVLAIFK